MIIRVWHRPEFIIPLSFILIIITGALTLYLGPSCPQGKIKFIDALFTATSAVSCTGLTVLDTEKGLTQFARITILVLVQLGGLGIMTYATLFSLFFIKKFSLRNRLILQGSLTEFPSKNWLALLRSIFIGVIILEGLGALLLFIIERRVFSAIFHAITAFCNAGFSLYSDNLCRYTENSGVNLVMTSLIILGGLGFVVLKDLKDKIFYRKKNPLSLQTKVVLSSSLFLILTGALLILWLEHNHSLSSFSPKGKFLAAYFQSVTSRTAGFNTIPISQFSPATLLVLIGLMFIGGSPGSTTGGIKTTTAVVFYKDILSKFTQRPASLFKRTIKEESRERAIVIMVLAVILILSITFFLLLIEKKTGLTLFFEVTSAFATVGLSTGLTPTLSSLGKLLICFTMYAGKLGPLTLSALFIQRKGRILYHYPQENIMTG